MKGNLLYTTEPEDRFTVWDVYFTIIPFNNLGKDRNGRTVPIRTKVVSQNGRHTICRDFGQSYSRSNGYAVADLLVDKVVRDDSGYRIHTRRTRNVGREVVK